MKPRILLLSLTLIIASAFATCVRAAATPGTEDVNKKYDIAGGVIHSDTKKPLSNVSVTAYSTSKKEKVALTDVNGNYAFSDLKPGTYKLVFEKNGFKKVVRDKVNISPSEGLQLSIQMSEESGEFQIMPGQLLFSEFD
jgi:hypothetical protein